MFVCTLVSLKFATCAVGESNQQAFDNLNGDDLAAHLLQNADLTEAEV